MDVKKQNAYFEAIEKKLKERGIEPVRIPGAGKTQVGDTLRFLLSMSDEGGAVMMELLILDMGEDEPLLTFYTTLFTDVKDILPDLRVEIPAWNFLCPLGSFGIFEEAGQLYHKYAVPFAKDASEEELCETAFTVMKFLYEIVGEKYLTTIQMMMAE